MAIMVGQELKGFCDGWFGRDAYGNKRVEAVGADWVVARNEDGQPVFASGKEVHFYLEQYAKRQEDEEDPN